MLQQDRWQQFYRLNIDHKLDCFSREGEIFDVLYAQQFDRVYLEELFDLANKIRTIAKTKEGNLYLATLLADKHAMLFFAQPSTRTFLSFLHACHILGLRISETRDSSTSSEVKGESIQDMIRTFSSYVDIIITRHVDEGFAEQAAWVLNNFSNRPIPVINAGSGKDQHPTQALLDMYTLDRCLKQHDECIDRKKIAMIGDLKRGRTVRSLCRLLALYHDIEIFFISPPEFAMGNDILDFLDDQKIQYTVTDQMLDYISEADALYVTRIQDEYDVSDESQNVDYKRFSLKSAHLKLLKPHAVIMHPFPRRDEIATDIDGDDRAAYWKQARNGMWIRAALILRLLKQDHCVFSYEA